MTVNALYNEKIAQNSKADLIGSEPVTNCLDDRSFLSSITVAGLHVCGESNRSEAFVGALGVELVSTIIVCGRARNINGHLLRRLRHRVAAQAARGLRKAICASLNFDLFMILPRPRGPNHTCR